MNTKLLIIIVLFASTAAITIESKYDSDQKHLLVHQDHNRYYGSTNSNRSSGVGDSFFVCISGLVLFFTMIPCLWFNERRYLVNSFRLGEAEKICKEVNCLEVDPNCEQQLVFTTGNAKTNNVLTDAQFAVSEVDSIKLERIVEMLQWRESSVERNNQTEYSYKLEWSSNFTDSYNFFVRAGHENDQGKWVVQKQSYLAQDVFLGEYLLSDSLKQQTSNMIPIQLNQENAKIAAQQFSGVHKSIICQNNSILFLQYPEAISSGDLRVTFMKVPCKDISVVSQQTQRTFKPYYFHDKYEEPQQAGCCSVIKNAESPIDQIDWIYEFTTTKKKAFYEKLAENTRLTFYLRIGGWLAMCVGLCMFFSPISFLISYVPLLGNFLASVTSFIFGVVSFVIATPIALITIALAWLFYRPIIAIGLVLIAGLIGGTLFFYIHMQNK